MGERTPDPVEYPIATSSRSFTLVERATPRLLLENLGTSVPTQVRVVSGCLPFCWSSRVFGLGPVGQRGAKVALVGRRPTDAIQAELPECRLQR